jgi:hypothetical protein
MAATHHQGPKGSGALLKWGSQGGDDAKCAGSWCRWHLTMLPDTEVVTRYSCWRTPPRRTTSPPCRPSGCRKTRSLPRYAHRRRIPAQLVSIVVRYVAMVQVVKLGRAHQADEDPKEDLLLWLGQGLGHGLPLLLSRAIGRHHWILLERGRR